VPPAFAARAASLGDNGLRRPASDLGPGAGNPPFARRPGWKVLALLSAFTSR